MKDFKKMYLLNLVCLKNSFRIIFPLYLFGLLIPSAELFVVDYIFTDHELTYLNVSFVFVMFLIIQIVSMKNIPYDKTLLLVHPFKKLNLYPISILLSNLTIWVIYFIPYFLIVYRNNNFIFGLINISLFYLLIYFLNSTILKINNNLLLVNVYFSTYWIAILGNKLFKLFSILNSHYLTIAIFLSFIIALLIITFNVKGFKINNKKSNTSKTKMIKSSSVDKLIREFILNSFEPIYLFITVSIIIVLTFITQSNYIINSKNIILSIFVIMFIKGINPGKNIISLLGLPVTPKMIYIETLKFKSLGIFIISILFIAADYLLNKNLSPTGYAINFIIIAINLFFEDLIYPVYKFKQFNLGSIIATVFIIKPLSIEHLSSKAFIFLAFLCIASYVIYVFKNLKTINFNTNDIIFLNEKNLKTVGGKL